MQNSPTIISIPPPLPQPFPPPFPFPPPPRSTGQIVVLPAPPPPPFRPFAGAPSSVFQITVLPAPPPPPSFTGDSSSIDLSPLEFLLALIAIVAIPALIYTFIFAYGCSSSSRHRRSSTDEVEVSGDPSIASEHSRHDVESVPTGEVYKKETHAAKIGGECPVCLSVFVEGEEVRQLSVCKHSFHTSCIDLWLNNHNNCPICRTTVAAVAADSKVKSSGGSSRDSDLQQGLPDASSLV